MNWLEVIFNYLKEVWPWARLKPWEGGLRVTYWPFMRPRIAVLLGPATIRDLPWIDDLTRKDMREDTYNLPTQSITTADNIGVSFSANFVYEVVDVAKAIAHVNQFDNSLQDLAMLHLHDKMRRLTWAELLSGQKELETSLKDTLTTKARDWGVRIIRAGFTDLVQAKQMRIFGDTMLSATV